MKSARRRARELALQGLYSWLLAGQPASDIAAQLKESKGYERADAAYFSALLHGAIEQQHEIEKALEPCLDRPLHGLSPVERAILLLGAWELKNVPDVPYKVVINEAVELAKSFGGTEGHKFVNGVLDKLARSMRTQAADSV
jgi:N utilization substance protein B